MTNRNTMNQPTRDPSLYPIHSMQPSHQGHTFRMFYCTRQDEWLNGWRHGPEELSISRWCQEIVVYVCRPMVQSSWMWWSCQNYNDKATRRGKGRIKTTRHDNCDTGDIFMIPLRQFCRSSWCDTAGWWVTDIITQGWLGTKELAVTVAKLNQICIKWLLWSIHKLLRLATFQTKGR